MEKLVLRLKEWYLEKEGKDNDNACSVILQKIIT